MVEERYLIVQADDFGACPAVTDGIVSTFTDGVVTQASVMPPAPDAARALWLAGETSLPLGVHLTLVSEWETLKWYPLTPARSMREPDGSFPPGIAELRARAAPADVLTELRAQLARVHDAGATPGYLECHVGVFNDALLAELSAETGLACRDRVPDPGRTMPLDSVWHLSIQPIAEKITALLAHIASLPPGLHMVVGHPAVDRDELRWLCAPTSRRWRWARDIRVSDAAALLDPRVREACQRHDVRLTSWAEVAQVAQARTVAVKDQQNLSKSAAAQ